jgi:hypothetical protein
MHTFLKLLAVAAIVVVATGAAARQHSFRDQSPDCVCYHGGLDCPCDRRARR